MRDLAGWEMLLGGALLIFLLWRWRPGSTSRASADRPEREQGGKPDWPGFALPILLVVIFVLAMIAVLRS